MSGKRSTIRQPGASTIFARMTQLAQETGAINLGQGFPDTDGPAAVLGAARDAIEQGLNQYPPARGLPVLLEAIAQHQQQWYGIDVDPRTDILVTVGATEAIASALLAFVSPGDEVVMFEPYYDSYAAMVTMAGGRRRCVPLRFPTFELDVEALEAAFSERTAVVVLNTPHNPTGKVFTSEELAVIARLAEQHDAIVLSDEVYEHLVLDAERHVPIASLPGMAERTLTISSGGKTFNTTGWKVGWLSGPEDLVATVAAVKQYLTFAACGPFQTGIARGLQMPTTFFEGRRQEMKACRDHLMGGLAAAGFDVAAPEGGYFVLADAAPLGVCDAADFALALPREAGVVAVPASVFCDDPEATGLQTVMRFAFCKQPSTVEAACTRLVDRYAQSSL